LRLLRILGIAAVISLLAQVVSARSSTALRDLPAMTRERGYALRTSLGVNF